VDKTIRWQASSLGVGLTVRYDGDTPIRCDVSGSLGQLDAVKAMVAKAMQPAEPRTIEAWLAELSVIAPARKEDGFTTELKLRAYTDRLTAFPADVARAALLVHVWPFFPSWAELDGVCRKLVAPRLVMASAKAPEPDKPRGPPPNPEQVRELMERYGFAPKRASARTTRETCTAEEWAAYTAPPSDEEVAEYRKQQGAA